MAAEMRRKVGRVERAKDRRAADRLHETDEKLERGRSLVQRQPRPSRSPSRPPGTPTTSAAARRLDPAVRLHPAAARRRPRRRVRRRHHPARDRACRGSRKRASDGHAAWLPTTGARSLDDLLRDFGTRMPRKDRPSHPSHRRTGSFPVGPSAVGATPAGHGWAPTLPPLAGYQMTSEQTPVAVAADRRRRAAADRGAAMGFDVLSGGAFYCDPMGWVTRRLDPGHQPQRLHLRQTRPRQVAHGQGVHAPDDPVRLPLPGARRRQGRVRGHLPRASASSRTASAPACRAGSTRWTSARSALDWEQQDRAETAAPRRGDLQPLAHPDPRPGRLPGRRRSPRPRSESSTRCCAT